VLDGGQRGKRSDLDATSLLANIFQFRNVPDIEHVLGLEQFLPHGRNEVGASGYDS
jgi:hypothetical protein